MDEEEQMLFDLAENDFIKVDYLRNNVPRIKLYERYYLTRVTRLNEKLDAIASMKNIKKK